VGEWIPHDYADAVTTVTKSDESFVTLSKPLQIRASVF